MRNISFALTTDQVRARTKTVTRRLGWKDVKPGEPLQPVAKCQGLKKGERITKIAPPIRVVAASRELVYHITAADVVREGFPDMTPREFVAFFCKHNRCTPDTEITRIEFAYD